MEKTINSDLIRGNINTIILKSLYSGDRYGYDIVREIEIKSHGQYILKQPTLYSCLKRLESQGFIRAYWGTKSNGGRRKYYTLTDMGREVFMTSQDEYEYSRTIIDNLISDKSYDLSTLPPSKDSTLTEEDLRSFDQQNNDKPKVPIELESEECNDVIDSSSLENESNSDGQTNNDNNNEIVHDINELQSNNNVFSEIKESSTINSIGEVKEQNTHEELTFDIDTSSIMNDLLSKENTSSYSNVNEQISPILPDTFASLCDFSNSNNSYDVSQFANNDYSQADDYDGEQINMLDMESSYANDSKTGQNINDENTNPEFISYDAQVDNNTTIPTNYKDVLSNIMQKSDQNDTTQVHKTEPVYTNTLKEKILIRNFGKITESMQELGNDVKIRPLSNTAKEYKQKYFYRNSLVALYQYGILFVIMLLEIFASFLILKLGFHINQDIDNIIYIISIFIALFLPLIATINYLIHPFSKKRFNFNIKTALLFRIIIMIQCILIIYAINIYFGMSLSIDKEFLYSFIIPVILTTNIPLSTIIFNSLYKKDRFKVE